MSKLQTLLHSLKYKAQIKKVERIVSVLKETPGLKIQELSEVVGHDAAGLNRYIRLLRKHEIIAPRNTSNGYKSEGYKLISENIGE